MRRASNIPPRRTPPPPREEGGKEQAVSKEIRFYFAVGDAKYLERAKRMMEEMLEQPVLSEPIHAALFAIFVELQRVIERPESNVDLLEAFISDLGQLMNAADEKSSDRGHDR